MKTIELNKGYIVLVDDADYQWASQFVWRAIVRRRKDGSIRTVYVARTEDALKCRQHSPTIRLHANTLVILRY
jgi:hypothetical protein